VVKPVEPLKALEVLFHYSGMAPLTRQEHAHVVATVQSLKSWIEGKLSESKPQE
jgi:hypothetical protein